MSYPAGLSEQLEGFSGRAPLFPLPNVAFFPHVLLPLHIFEPRYRQMTADALDGERLIAMAQLKPGWEDHRAADSPPIYDYLCLGRITAQEKLEDGRYYLILQGMARARVLAEERGDLPYRIGQLELVPDRVPPLPAIDRENRRREIMEAFRDLFPRAELDKLLQEAVGASAPIGIVCDIVASALSLPTAQVQEILAEADIDERSEIVLRHLRKVRRSGQESGPKRFPPDFSDN